MEPPTTDWRSEPWPEAALRGQAPLAADWQRVLAPVTHTFTHFHLTLAVFTAEIPAGTSAPAPCRWIARRDLPDEALPSVMRKVLAAAEESLAAKS